MVLIIKGARGEYREDYYESVDHVYELPDGLTGEMVEKSYLEMIISMMSQNGIAVHPKMPSMILHRMHQPEGKEPSKEKKKLHRKLLKENTLIDFIERQHGVKKVEFHEITV